MVFGGLPADHRLNACDTKARYVHDYNKATKELSGGRLLTICPEAAAFAGFVGAHLRPTLDLCSDDDDTRLMVSTQDH